MAVDNVVADDRGAPGSARRRLPWTVWLPTVLIALGGAMVALNVLDLGFRGLAGELRYNQGAPAGWLWAERVAYLGFGPEVWPGAPRRAARRRPGAGHGRLAARCLRIVRLR